MGVEPGVRTVIPPGFRQLGPTVVFGDDAGTSTTDASTLGLADETPPELTPRPISPDDASQYHLARYEPVVRPRGGHAYA